MNRCIFQAFVFDDKIIFLMILPHTIKQRFSFLWHLVCEISHFEFDDYHVILPGASDLKLLWAVYLCGEFDMIVHTSAYIYLHFKMTEGSSYIFHEI